MVTGTPVRGDFFRYTRQEAREKLGLTDERPLLLSYWVPWGGGDEPEDERVHCP